MNFGFTEEQKMLRDSARNIFNKELPKDRVREIQNSETGFSKELWMSLVNLGWLGLIFPEEYGGSGMSFMELAVLYEECGKAVMPSVFYSTIAGGLCLLNGGSEEQKKSLLPEIINGNKLITLAVMESQSIHDINYIEAEADYREGKYYVTGTKLFVQNAISADYFIVAARTDYGSAEENITLFLIDSSSDGITSNALLTFGLDHQSEVMLDNVSVSPENIIGQLGQAKRTMDKTVQQITVLQCAEMLGGVQEVLRMTSEYVKQRIQFDKPIGSFQAVQHHLANVSTGIEGARYIVYNAVWRLSNMKSCAKEISLAKAYISEVYKSATLICHQLHGGIGYTLDYDLHLYSNRAKSFEICLGNRDYHLQKLADELGM